ncbi:sulfite exporter TauE/SafE family protein [Planctomycetota bacterium]
MAARSRQKPTFILCGAVVKKLGLGAGNMSIETVIAVVLGGFLCEFIDASMGMMYGTILSPVLIIAGFEPVLVVPSILLSQALGGLTASIFHHKFGNVNLALKTLNPKIIARKLSELGLVESFRRGTTKDLKVSFCVLSLGIVATIVAALVALSIPKALLKTYIGILVLVMGIILLSGSEFTFSWKKMIAVGVLSAFNKGMSGGGFGPVVTSGQIIAGRDGKSAIGATTFAEAPICIAGFLTFLLTKGISNWNLVIFLSIGALLGAPLGALLTSKLKSEKRLRIILAILTLILGTWTLIRTWFS